jgi:protein-S-isoprenylcysteine O-methyltransferase Ste14
MASYLLGTISIGLAIEGFRLLKIIGRPAASRDESANLAFENTTRLVTVGAYRWIRHPLYASLLALAWCAFFKNPSEPASIVLTLGVSGFLLATALAEEGENLKRFGAAYTDYKKRTWRFIPFVF